MRSRTISILAGTDALDDLVAADDPTHGRVRDRLVVAGELDLAADRVGHLAVDLRVAVAALLRPGVGLRAVALLPHEPAEARLVDLQSLLGRHAG